MTAVTNEQLATAAARYWSDLWRATNPSIGDDTLAKFREALVRGMGKARWTWAPRELGMVKRGKDPKTVPLTYVAGVEGNSIYLNGYRIVGPKPWGGGRTIEEWEVTRDDIKTALSLTLSCTSPLSAWKNPAKKPVQKVRKRGA